MLNFCLLRAFLQGAVSDPAGWARQAVFWAGVAQLVEHLICNQRVGGSNPFVSSNFKSAPVSYGS